MFRRLAALALGLLLCDCSGGSSDAPSDGGSSGVAQAGQPGSAGSSAGVGGVAGSTSSAGSAGKGGSGGANSVAGTGNTAGSSGAAGAGGSGGSPAPNCDGLPSEPVTTMQVPDIKPLEDVAFDDQGYIYWNEDDTIFKAKAGEKRVPVLTGVTVRAGMRIAPSGDLYIETENALERVSPEGVRTPVLDGVFLNGLEVDPLGRLYVTEFNGTRALRYDPKTDKTDVLSIDHMAKPNGITLSPNFDFLYVSSYGGSIVPTLYRIPLNADGSSGKTEDWVTGVGFGYFDGMAADACGNVYASDSGTGDVYRFSPDGKSHAIVVSRSAETLHNIQWGRGKGWDENKLYVVSLDKGLFVADVGVPGKKYW